MSHRVRSTASRVGGRGALAVGIVIALCLSALGSPAAAQTTSGAALCGDAQQIRDLGGPNRFADKLMSEEELQQMFVERRGDIELLLRQAGYAGDPQDLFDAVAAGDATRDTRVEPGERFGWMFFRKRGQPALKTNVCWAGDEAFLGWEVDFTSRGRWYSVVIPENCGNISLLAQMDVPVCRVQVADPAGESCGDTRFSIDASGSTADEVRVAITRPDGSTTTLGPGDATSRLRWTFDSSEPQGEFRFVVQGRSATPNGQELTCSAEATVTRDCCIATPPSIDLSASATTVTPLEEVLLRAAPEVSECTELESVTIGGIQVGAPYERTQSWEEVGTYDVTATVTDALGQQASDEVTIEVKTRRQIERERREAERERRREERRGASSTRDRDSADSRSESRGAGAAGDSDWRLRVFGGHVNTGSDQHFETVIVPALAPVPEQRLYHTESGWGAGVEAEVLFNDRFGLGFGALYRTIELHLMGDLPDLWTMSEDDVGGFSLFAAPLFHLTPNSRVDFFLGPMLAWTDWDDASLSSSNLPVRQSFDDEVSLGAQIGIDIPFSRDGSVGLYAGGIYLDSTLDSDVDDMEIDLEPLFLHLGLFFRF